MELMPLWLGIENRLTSLLGLYFTVNLAVIGWVVTRKEEMTVAAKIVALIGYLLFAAVLLLDLDKTFAVARQLNVAYSSQWPAQVTLGLPDIPDRRCGALFIYAIGVIGVSAAILAPRRWLNNSGTESCPSGAQQPAAADAPQAARR